MTSTRLWLDCSATLFAAACVFAPVTSFAQDYPSRPIQMIIPFAAGGGFDQTARNTAQALAEVLKQPIAPFNIDGAAGSAKFAWIGGLTWLGNTLIVSDNGNNRIRTVAGDGNNIYGNTTNGIELAAGSYTGATIAANRIVDNVKNGIATSGGVTGLTTSGLLERGADHRGAPSALDLAECFLLCVPCLRRIQS